MIGRTLTAFALRFGRGEWAFRQCNSASYLDYAEFLRRHRGMRIGAGTSINPHCCLMDHAWVTIGRNCSISFATFVTHSGGDRVIREAWGHAVSSRRPIVVGDNCIVGANATIMYGVRIGDDCVIGAGSYVCRDVPSGTLVRPVEAPHAGSTEGYVQRLVRRTSEAAGEPGPPAFSPPVPK